MKRITLILLAAAVLAMLMTGTALANFGPHGGYSQDTDACAGCHRAHTAFSSVTWSDGTNDHSALLVSNSTTMKEFCYACHGNAAPGASTNVQDGKFDAGPSGPVGVAANGTNQNDGVTIAYETNSSFDTTLNGGGFEKMGPTATAKPITSNHGMDSLPTSAPAWGYGSSVPEGKNLTCTDCHDPHGSSNYRLLRDSLAYETGQSTAVGGYDTNGDPTPFVVSAEENYPANGWEKGAAGTAQMAVYKPNYTTYEWRNNGAADKSMSQWCAGCHTNYATKTGLKSDPPGGPYSTYSYGSFIGAGGNNKVYHRHPVDTSLTNGMPGNVNGTLPTNVLLDQANLPLEHAGGSTRADALDYSDYMGCETCHYAHGAWSSMAGQTGWAQSGIDAAGNPYLLPQAGAGGGTEPNKTASLLRVDGRGVCERCHNK